MSQNAHRLGGGGIEGNARFFEGFFFSAGGPELELFYVAAAVALILTGPGRLALQVPALDDPRMRMVGVALAIAGSIVAILISTL